MRLLKCWLFGHKWEGKRAYLTDGNCEICSRCALRGQTDYYRESKIRAKYGIFNKVG